MAFSRLGPLIGFHILGLWVVLGFYTAPLKRAVRKEDGGFLLGVSAEIAMSTEKREDCALSSALISHTPSFGHVG